MHFTKEKQISLYPTQGEFYEYYLSNFLPDYQLNCKIYPQVPNVQIMNQCEEIYRLKGNQLISLSSNTTHFSTLSIGNKIIMYEWKNKILQQVGESVNIDNSFNCFNINLSKFFSIIVDCYKQNELFLIQLMDTQSIIAYQIQSYEPNSTKIQSIINGTNAFIIYAQYFEMYSILSLFSSFFVNQSSLYNQFVDFDIPITISPKIYVMTLKEILQLSISSESQFYQEYNYSIPFFLHPVISINAYYDLRTFPQCDQIALISSQNYVPYLLGCENSIVLVAPNEKLQYESAFKILKNNQFVVIQLKDKILIQELEVNNIYNYHLNHSKNSIIYFNSDNELFVFNHHISVYKIQLPSLQVNLTNLKIAGNNYAFSLICQNELKYFTYSNIQLQVLLQNDTNVYVIFNQYFSQYSFLEITAKHTFVSFSGQLLQYQQNPDGIPLKFTLTSQQKAGEIMQSYQLVQSLSIFQPNYYLTSQYLIGFNNDSIDILWSQNIIESYQFTKLCSISISINASSLQIAYSIYPQKIIIGLSDKHNIYLFQYYNESNSIISYANFTFKRSFSDFVATYNSIIILIPKKEIIIMTFNFTTIFTLNQETINQFFNKILFNPIQIVVNSQLQSSLLYINNIYEVIIISIDQNNFPIPISLIEVNFKIKQINLVNQQLILSYICNNDQYICFQVWNVQYLPKYYYLKNLYSLNVDSKVVIQSDNLFLYVTFSNYTVYIYNPSLPYHSSLYQILQLISPIQCASAIKSFQVYIPQFQYIKSMILLSDNTIYQINRDQKFELSVEFNNYNLNYSVNYPYIIYNYTVSSLLNNTAYQQTPNQSLLLYSNFTVFNNETYLRINLSLDNIIPQSLKFSYPLNLFLDRQVGYCGIVYNKTYNQNNQCSVSLNRSYSIPNLNNFSLITSINNECFALQNNSYIQMVNTNLNNLSNLSYSNLKLSLCLNSTSQNYTLYSICQNQTSQYLLNFTLNCDNKIEMINIQQFPFKFQNISKMSVILNQIFILGTFKQSFQQLYWFNFDLVELTGPYHQSDDFSIAKIPQMIYDGQSQKIIVFYTMNFQIHYIVLSIGNSTIQSQGVVEIEFCNQKQICSPLPNFYILVLIMQTYYQSVTILVSDTYFSYIVVVRLEQFKLYNKNDFTKGRAIRSIPNYGNLTNTGNSFYLNGVLTQQFQLNYKNNSHFIVGVYYFNLFDENFIQPILMQSSFETSIKDYAIIIDQQYRNGTSLYFYNQTLYNYSIGTQNVTCIAYTKKGYMIVPIFCLNEFQYGIYNITFYLPPKFHHNFGSSAYILFSMILLLLSYFYFKFKSRTRNLEPIQYQIEL
ncbi:unnamed protein product [Paramecium octaurelia]|uniref:Transmembrane protein n=1 Tax=Paramecium octaurelia TaxID=43137 RepID=A0A8S1WMX2_PAROT|nr:unnamed protein product [Paramecium octaurelia]